MKIEAEQRQKDDINLSKMIDDGFTKLYSIINEEKLNRENTEKSLQDILNETNKIPIFIDLSNILYRSLFVFKPDKFKAPNGEPNGHLFGLCQLLRTCSKKGYTIFLCADSKCEWRQNLNEDYKSNRDSSIRVIDFYKQ